MNEVIITSWNNKVRPEDTIFVNGDFCFKNSPGGKPGEGMIHKANYWASKLNGNIVFIKGNHDRNNSLKTIIDKVVIKYGNHFINITHIPENYDDRFAINFVGHVHQNWKFKRVFNPMDESYNDLINIGVDVWDFQPVTFEEIYRQYRKWAKHERRTAVII